MGPTAATARMGPTAATAVTQRRQRRDGSDGSDGSDGTVGRRDGDGFTADEDCDDADPTVFPGAAEDCSDTDRNCDGDRTAGATDTLQGWLDSDGDGWGDAASPVEGCTLPANAVGNDGDCDDSRSDVNPDAAEICDGSVDEDCDGDIDEADSDVGSCDAASWNGTYTGGFTLTVTEATLGLSDSCTGTGIAVVDSSLATPITLDITCSFAGAFTTFFPGSQSVTVEGAFDTPNSASGTVTIVGIATDTWTGSFSSPGDFEAILAGSTTYSGFSVSYSGLFTGQR